MTDKTLRDEFALAIVQGLMANPTINFKKVDAKAVSMARDVYELADVFMAEKARSNKG